MACIACGTDSVLAALEAPPSAGRLIEATEIRFAEIISALSVALDITQGHPEGHCMRTALIGMRLANELRLPAAEQAALFYALLLKDLGCSSNAAKISYLFGSDDLQVKRTARMIDWTRPGDCLGHCWKNTARGGSVWTKLRKIGGIVSLGAEGGRKIAEIRCERGAEIARMLRLPEATARAIYDLDEHWDGRGNPCGLAGEEISLLGRICCLAQTVEVFYSAYGLEAALTVAQERSGKWFDPQLVAALVALRTELAFWQRVQTSDPLEELGRMEVDGGALAADEDSLDRVAEAFAKVVDAKSPWTYQHSARVADIAVGVAEQFGCGPELVRDLRRAALLHDIGKLGVSNLILDKPGRPTDDEFAQIRKHPEYSQRILEQVGAFAALADVAGGHHERLDGTGYHRRLPSAQIPWVTRVLTIADVCEAMSAQRPYRQALSWEQIQKILRGDAGRGVDLECLHALERWHDRDALPSRVEQQLEEVERVLKQW